VHPNIVLHFFCSILTFHISTAIMSSSSPPQPTTLPPANSTVDFCLSVNIYCPVEQTIYGYYPNLGANVFFCAFFGLCAFLQFVFGLRWKTWTFMIALTFGCISECLGKTQFPSSQIAIHLQIQGMLAVSCLMPILIQEMPSTSKSAASSLPQHSSPPGFT